MAPQGATGSTRVSKILDMLNPLTWRKRLDLDTRSFLMMLKGALPPTIVIAISQSSAIADITLTIGYLSALISVLSQCLMPRAKFMKIMFFELLSTCVSASLCCLAIFCAVEARKHNAPGDASASVKNGFSSDACAVSAVWLIFMIWGANTLRAWRPIELQDPMVAFSIFSSVTMTRAGTFVTLPQGLDFVSRLLKGFMIGFAIASGVSLFILPITSRGNVFHDIKGYVAQIETVIEAQKSFLDDSLEMFTGFRGLLGRTRTAHSTQGTENLGASDSDTKRKRLAESITKLNALHGKLQSDLFYSRHEIAWGKLAADDLNKINGFLRNHLLPLSGMAMLPEIMDMIVKNEPVDSRKQSSEEPEKDPLKRSEMPIIVEAFRERLADSSYLAVTGLQYVLLVFELVKRKDLKKKQRGLGDEESEIGELNPFQPGSSAQFESLVRRHFAKRKELRRTLAPLEPFSPPEKGTDSEANNSRLKLTADPDVRREFFLILYMGNLQENLLKVTLDMIKFADTKLADGTMKRSRLIFPKLEAIRGFLSLNSENKESDRDSEHRQSTSVESSNVYSEVELGKFPDPEHLPPENIWERASRILPLIPKFIKSEQSVFGFRVAAASFCVAILAFLHQTQAFFIQQRCIWAMIVIVIGMSPTSGQTLFGFVARIVATAISLALSLIVWYIVDGKIPGVIVFLYIANVFEYYFYVKVPQYFGASIIAIVTLNVIIGYECEVSKLGIQVAESNGQPYYPVYLFGPYKLATVAAGCAISFFWVIFPYPITAKSTLRKSLGRGLFILAKFYSCMHTTVELWLNGELGNVQDAQSASYRLETTRHKFFKEEMMLLNALRMHSHFTTFEPPISGKFPKSVYDNIIAETQRMLTSMALMAHTTQTLDALSTSTEPSKDPENKDKWVSRLASIALQSTGFRSQSTTSLLYHLSASMMNSQPLPPFLSTGPSFPLARQLQQIDDELLDIRHVEDPAFSAFLSLEVLRSVLSFSLRDLLSNVKTLVGELTFDFHIRHHQEYEESTHLMSNTSEQS